MHTNTEHSLSFPISPSPRPSTFSLHHFSDIQHWAVTLQKNREQIDNGSKTDKWEMKWGGRDSVEEKLQRTKRTKEVWDSKQVAVLGKYV